MALPHESAQLSGEEQMPCGRSHGFAQASNKTAKKQPWSTWSPAARGWMAICVLCGTFQVMGISVSEDIQWYVVENQSWIKLTQKERERWVSFNLLVTRVTRAWELWVSSITASKGYLKCIGKCSFKIQAERLNDNQNLSQTLWKSHVCFENPVFEPSFYTSEEIIVLETTNILTLWTSSTYMYASFSEA